MSYVVENRQFICFGKPAASVLKALAVKTYYSGNPKRSEVTSVACSDGGLQQQVLASRAGSLPNGIKDDQAEYR